MTEITTPKKPRCDCGLTFEDRRSLHEHVGQTGHMMTKSCTVCCQVLKNPKGLEQHRKNSPRHKGGSTSPSATTTKFTSIKLITQVGAAAQAKDDLVSTPPDAAPSRKVKQKKEGAGAGACVQPTDASSLSAASPKPVKLRGIKQENQSRSTKKAAEPPRRPSLNELAESSSLGNTSGAPAKKTSTPPSVTRKTKNPANLGKSSPVGVPAPQTAPRSIQPAKPEQPSREAIQKPTIQNTLSNYPVLPKKHDLLGVPESIESIPTAHQVLPITMLPAETPKPQANIASGQIVDLVESLPVPAPVHKATLADPVETRPIPAPVHAATFAAKHSINALTLYPWVSPAEDPSILYTLHLQCHDERRIFSNTSNALNPNQFLSAPAPDPCVPKRAAIVVDCEMVEISGRRSDVVSVCAVDFVTGAVLLHALVEPTDRVVHWRTRVSGVSASIMRDAKAAGGVLGGWPEARARLFDLVDADTVFVGHALTNDLRALHITHDRVVDSSIVTAEAAFGREAKRFGRTWGLQTLCRDLLGVAIQDAPTGHDCVEDALATREFVLWCIKHPLLLEAWATAAGEIFEREKEERAEKQRAKARVKAAAAYRKYLIDAGWPQRYGEARF
ncbi:Uu.00g146610.m01.CDS01 [Anthostomella pinea]|uniref:Uu.00g146610.m01.CDS01 n=1 Tax=Anthostomella pinea TaxID=933095 RepID=A0AAI8YM37_9PEZI|nr:Uu.00g146610.m01.CDS01 [Anthostomella pinea]